MVQYEWKVDMSLMQKYILEKVFFNFFFYEYPLYHY